MSTHRYDSDLGKEAREPRGWAARKAILLANGFKIEPEGIWRDFKDQDGILRSKFTDKTRDILYKKVSGGRACHLRTQRPFLHYTILDKYGREMEERAFTWWGDRPE